MPYSTGETMAIWTPLDSILSNLRVGDLLMEQDLTWQATVAVVSVLVILGSVALRTFSWAIRASKFGELIPKEFWASSLGKVVKWTFMLSVPALLIIVWAFAFGYAYETLLAW